MIVACKDNRVRIEVTNLSYTSKNLGAPSAFRDIPGPGGILCDNAGSCESLVQCKAAPAAIQNIDQFVRSSVAGYVKDFSTYMKGGRGTDGVYNGVLKQDW